MQEHEYSCAWICPNDRHLALRAKLRSGWSVRSDQTTRKGVSEYSSEELEQIQGVISKAAMLEEFEQERIGSLVDKLNMMKKNSMGDGLATCVLCAEEFGKFLGNVPVTCADCKKKVCNKCCVDYRTGARPTTGKQNAQSPSFHWLCKICSEDRELWKRSGAWFFQALPRYKLPKPSHSMLQKRHLQAQSNFRPSPLLTRKGQTLDSPASRKGHTRAVSGDSLQSFHWEKPAKPNYTSSSEDVESSDDDGITLGRVRKTNSQASDSVSFTSSTSAASFDKQSLSASSSPAALRKLPSRRARRDKRTPHLSVLDGASVDGHVTDSSVDNSRQPVDMSNLHSGSNGNSLMETESTEDVNYRGIDSRGSIEFCVMYDPSKCTLHITIIRAQNLIGMDSNGLSDPYVKLHLLPGISRSQKYGVTKLRTKTKNKTLNPVFNEMLTYWGILEQELPKRKLLLTVLDEDTFGHDFIGEIVIPLINVTPNSKKSFNLPLKAPYALTENEKIPPDSGRIYVGLCYNISSHLLTVKIHRCSYLVSRKKDQETVNAYVKVTLSLDDRRAIVKKTEVKKKTQNPMFDRELKFQVSADNGQAELARGSLEVAVMHKDSIGHDAIGIVKFGIKSSGDQLKQWFSCLKHADQQFDTWHILSMETTKKTKGKS